MVPRDPDVPAEAWADWRWQLAHAARDAEAVARALGLPAPDGPTREVARRYPVAITPYLAALIRTSPGGPALARQFAPGPQEARAEGDADPLDEEGTSPVPGLVRRYPDRAVILTTNACPAYCRFCTRKRRVGSRAPTWFSERRAVLAYLRAHPEIRDVLVSGGDPLILPTPALARLLDDLEALTTLEVIRVATRAPVTLPQRLDDDALVARLARSRRVWVNTQINHPDELTEEARRALGRLVDAGIPVGNQAVLLRDVNDDPELLAALFRACVAARVRPYYLFVCEPGRGTAHFRLPVARAVALHGTLRGRVSGLAIPTLALDLPGAAGKVSLGVDPIVGREGGELLVRGWQGRIVRYPDPEG